MALSCSQSVVRNNGFCGHQRCQRFFFLADGRGKLFDPMCLYSKYSEFCGEFKMDEQHTHTHTQRILTPTRPLGWTLAELMGKFFFE